jgi:hypothetical protein
MTVNLSASDGKEPFDWRINTPPNFLPMYNQKIIASLATAALLLPGVSKAAILLDTGMPTGGLTASIGSSSLQAAEFYATQGETITQLSVDLSKIATGNGDLATLYLFGSNISRSPAALTSASAVFNASGWTSANVDYVIGATGYYYIAVGSSVGTTFDAPSGATTSSGTVPATAFAFSSNSGSQYSAETSGIGFQVVGVPAPEPTSYGAMAGLGLLVVAVGSQLRRRQV